MARPDRKEQIERAFTYHPPQGDQQERYQALRQAGKDLALLIVDLVPEGREQSVALTNLEQTIMWSNAGISRAE